MRKRGEKSQVAESEANKNPKNVLTLVANRAYILPVKRRTMRKDAVIKLLKQKQGERSMRQFAAELGISAPYLCDLYKGRRYPGPKVLSKLGLAKKEVPSEPTYEVA